MSKPEAFDAKNDTSRAGDDLQKVQQKASGSFIDEIDGDRKAKPNVAVKQLDGEAKKNTDAVLPNVQIDGLTLQKEKSTDGANSAKPMNHLEKDKTKALDKTVEKNHSQDTSGKYESKQKQMEESKHLDFSVPIVTAKGARIGRTH